MGGAPPIKTGPGGPPLPTKLPKTLKVPVTFDELFNERDARAVDAIGYLRCLEGTVNAIRGGALGKIPPEWSMTCVEQGNEWRGVFGTLTDKGIRVRLQYAFRGNRPRVVTDRVDTSKVNGTARALLRGLSVPLPGKGIAEFAPIALPQTKFVEVWFLPLPSNPTRAIVGGDSLIQMTADGMRELGHGRTTPPIRQVSVPLQGSSWTLESSEERIPALSELLVARMALDLVPEVHIRTHQFESVFKRGARFWIHTPR